MNKKKKKKKKKKKRERKKKKKKELILLLLSLREGMSLPTTPPPQGSSEGNQPTPPTQAQGWGNWMCCGGSVDKFGKKTRISNWSETPIELHLKCGEALVRTYPIPHSGRKKLRWDRARQLCGGDDSNISVWVMGHLSDSSELLSESLSAVIREPITSRDLHGCTEIKIRRHVDNPDHFFLLRVQRQEALARRASGSSRAGRRSHHSSSRFSCTNSNNSSSSRYIYRSPVAARPSVASSSSFSQMGVQFHSLNSYDSSVSGRSHQQAAYHCLSSAASNSALPAAAIDGIAEPDPQHNADSHLADTLSDMALSDFSTDRRDIAESPGRQSDTLSAT